MIRINEMNDAELMQFLQSMRRLGSRGHYAHSPALHNYASQEAKKRKLI